MIPRCWPFEPVPQPKECECLRGSALKFHYDWYLVRLRRLNELLKRKAQYRSMTLGALYCDLRGESLRELRRLAGCVYIHELYFGALGKECMPKGRLRVVLEVFYGSFDAFREAFQRAADSLPVPGTVWLLLGHDHGPCIRTYCLCDRPCDAEGCPLLVLDLWEHAWLPAFSCPEAYLEAFWRCVNWSVVEERYLRCCCRL